MPWRACGYQANPRSHAMGTPLGERVAERARQEGVTGMREVAALEDQC